MNVMEEVDMEDSPSPRPHSSSSNRRTNKPLVEKRRRARINSCLTQLKSLVLQAMKQDSAQFSRLEKADILEMTVKYLRHLQRQQVSVVMATNPEVAAKYRAGFSECANEVMRYLGPASGISHDVRARLNDHLTGRLSGTRGGPSPSPPSPVPLAPAPAHPAAGSPPREEAGEAGPSPKGAPSLPPSDPPRASPPAGLLPLAAPAPAPQEGACLMQPLQIQIPERGGASLPGKPPAASQQGLLLMPILPVQPCLAQAPAPHSLAPKPARSPPRALESGPHGKAAFAAPLPPPPKAATPTPPAPAPAPPRTLASSSPSPGLLLRRPVALSHPTPIKLSPPPPHGSSGLEKAGEACCSRTREGAHWQQPPLLLCSPQHCSFREEKLWRPW